MVEIAVEKLRSFCAVVSIAGNRADLSDFAPLVHETRVNAGPGAGIEAALKACTQEWAMFLPVDVPLVPAELLSGWAGAVLAKAKAGCAASFLLANGDRQPAFCLLRRTAVEAISAALDRGERRIDGLLAAVDAADRGRLWVCDAARFAPKVEHRKLENQRLAMEFWFRNVNTPQELAEAELWSEALAASERASAHRL